MSADHTSPATVPPMVPGPLLVPQQTTIWPKVIGIIAIVLAALGLVSSAAWLLFWVIGRFIGVEPEVVKP